ATRSSEAGRRGTRAAGAPRHDAAPDPPPPDDGDRVQPALPQRAAAGPRRVFAPDPRALSLRARHQPVRRRHAVRARGGRTAVLGETRRRGYGTGTAPARAPALRPRGRRGITVHFFASVRVDPRRASGSRPTVPSNMPTCPLGPPEYVP